MDVLIGRTVIFFLTILDGIIVGREIFKISVVWSNGYCAVCAACSSSSRSTLKVFTVEPVPVRLRLAAAPLLSEQILYKSRLELGNKWIGFAFLRRSAPGQGLLCACLLIVFGWLGPRIGKLQHCWLRGPKGPRREAICDWEEGRGPVDWSPIFGCRLCCV